MYFDRFSKTIESHAMVGKGSKILAALSGGSDSVAMLLLLLEYKKSHPELEITIEALHFNHKIRGNDADNDALFCKNLCERLGVPYTLSEESVPLVSAKTGESIETAARNLRYEALRKRAAEMGENTKIAVAHNRGDNAETVFFNAIRGTSLEGLRGIRYVTRDVIRPLLDITKDETFEICSEYGIDFRTDKTNFETDATRNKIRLEIFPFIDEKLGCNISEKLTSLSNFAEIDCDFIEKEAEKSIKEVDEGGKLNAEKLLEKHEAIKTRIIRSFISHAFVNGERPFKDNVSVSKSMVLRTLDFAENGTSGGIIELGKGLYAKKTGKYLIFTDLKEISIIKEYDMNTFEVSGTEIKSALIKAKESNEYVVLFDKDRLLKLTDGKLPVLRAPQTGDFFATIGGSGKKPLRRFLTDVKIPKDERENIRVLAHESMVLHIFGVRRSKYATIQNDTNCAIIYQLVTR